MLHTAPTQPAPTQPARTVARVVHVGALCITLELAGLGAYTVASQRTGAADTRTKHTHYTWDAAGRAFDALVSAAVTVQA